MVKLEIGKKYKLNSDYWEGEEFLGYKGMVVTLRDTKYESSIAIVDDSIGEFEIDSCRLVPVKLTRKNKYYD